MVMGSLREEAELVIVGSGPGGYVAALRAADLGKEVVLVEEREQPGGACLLEGCIPSKTLINAVDIAETARNARKLGLTFEKLTIDPVALRLFASEVVSGLSKGVTGLLKNRRIEVIRGRARFSGPHALELEGSSVSGIDFRECIIATGASPIKLPDHEALGLWTSTEALTLPSIPPRLTIIGGGYIGLELGLVYGGLGSAVTVVELSPTLLVGGPDRDLVDVMLRACEGRFAGFILGARVSGMERSSSGLAISLEHEGRTIRHEADEVLVSVGRRANIDIDLDRAGLAADEKGRIPVDGGCRTKVPHIFAIGDVTPGPMLAHKASREGKVAAEVLAGHPSAFDNRAIPAVIFTDPEIAWAGLTEREAKEQGRPHRVGRFPLNALGRARTIGRSDGLTKVIADPDTGLVLGVGMVGPHASDLIAEATLAIEMGATLEDLMVTIHPHPTLSEALLEAAEAAAGQPIHQRLLDQKRE